MKFLWLLPVVVLGIAWWMRKSSNAKTRSNPR
jgi:hypothetical protein